MSRDDKQDKQNDKAKDNRAKAEALTGFVFNGEVGAVIKENHGTITQINNKR